MAVLPDSEFAIALVIGTLAIWFHSWNRFNQPSYRETSSSRILVRLRPVDMRKGSIFIRAYLIYALILTAIYLLICFYAFLLPSLPETFRADIPGLDLDRYVGARDLPEQATTGASLGSVEPDAGGLDASLPLLVALAVVGLAPNVPALRSVEEWIRAKAHSLAGIPTHLIDSGLKLRSTSWLRPDRKEGLLVAPEDWKLIDDVQKVAEREGFSERTAVRQHLVKILALRSWVMRDRVFPPDPRTRYEYHELEAEVQQQTVRLLGRLDAFRSASPPRQGSSGAPERKAEWQDIVSEADTLCADMSVLVALYSERDAFAAEIKTARASEPPSDDPAERERREAVDIFVKALESVSLVADRDSFGTTLFFPLGGFIVLAAALLGLLFGDARVEGISGISGHFVLAFQYAVTAIITYTIPLFFALTFQQEGLKRGRWENIFGPKKARAVAQYVTMFMIAVLIALTGLVANNVISAIADQNAGLAKVVDKLLLVLQVALIAEAPRSILGGVLALCVVLIIDAWHDGKLVGWGTRRDASQAEWPWWPWVLTILPAIGLGGIAWWERASTSTASPKPGLVPFLSSIMSHWSAGAVPALIGLFAAAYVIQSLMEEFPDSKAGQP